MHFSTICLQLVMNFLFVFRANEKALLEEIAKEGKITDAIDAKLKTVVTNFLASFAG